LYKLRSKKYLTTAFVVPAKLLIEKLAMDFKEKNILTQPVCFEFVKTSHAKEKSPESTEWFFIRAGSIFRKIYFKNFIGVQALRKCYSQGKNRGSRPERSTDASGKIIRNILQQLEKAGLVERYGAKGRRLSPKGVSYIDKIATEIKTQFPELSQY
jgi:small subunit ribosomal protein S19e